MGRLDNKVATWGNGKPRALARPTAMIHAAQRVEERLEVALADVGLSCATFGALNVLVDQSKPISLCNHFSCRDRERRWNKGELS